MDNKSENLGDLGDFFNVIGKAKKQKEEEFRSVVGDISFDGIFNNLKEENIKLKKKKKKEKKQIEQLEKFLFEDVDKEKKSQKEELTHEEMLEEAEKRESENEKIELTQEVEELTVEVEEVELEEIQENDHVDDAIKVLDKIVRNKEELSEETDYELIKKEIKELRTLIHRNVNGTSGGGEVRLEFLDDVDRDSAKVNGKFLKYDSSSGKFVGASGGGGGGSQSLNDTLGIGNTSDVGMSVGVVTATSFKKSGGTSSQFLKADGSVDSSNYATEEFVGLSTVGISTSGLLSESGDGSNLTGIVTSIVAGSNVTISGSTGRVTINASGGSGGTGGKFNDDQTNSGIHTTSSNVGLGTTNPRYQLEVGSVGAGGTQLWVNGDARITGILSVGTATITLNSTTNEIKVGSATTIHSSGIDLGSGNITSHNINSSGIITATTFVGDGSGITGVVGSGSGISIKNSGSNVGTAGTINFGTNLSVSAISGGSVTVNASGASEAFVGLSTVGLATESIVSTQIGLSTSGLASEAFVGLSTSGLASEAFVGLSTAGISTSGLASQVFVGLSTAGISTSGLASQVFVGLSTAGISTSGLASQVFVGLSTAGLATQDFVGLSTVGLATQDFVGLSTVGLATESIVSTQIGLSTSGLATQDFVGLSTAGISTAGLATQDFVGLSTAGISTSGLASQVFVGLSTAGLASESFVGLSTFTGDYNNLRNKPTIPTNNNQLTNGAGYITEISGINTSGTSFFNQLNASGIITAATFSGNLPTTDLTGTITNAQLAGSIANSKLTNSSVSYGGISLSLGGSDATPAFNLSDATDYPTSSLSGTITNAQLAGSIANAKLTNSSVSYGGVELALGSSDATPAFNLSDATAYPYNSLTGISTEILGDASPQLGGDLSLNSKTINGTGGISVVGVVTATSLDTATINSVANLNVASNALTIGDANDTITIAGNLTVNGTEIIINADTLEVEDRNIGIASTASGAKLDNAGLDGAGITIYGSQGDKTLTWSNSNSRMQFNTALSATSFSGSGSGLTDIPNSALTNSSVSFGGISVSLGSADSTPAFDLSDATNYPTSSLSGTITNAQLAGSIANAKLASSSVSYGGISLSLGGSDATPAFDLADATNYPTSSLSGTITNAQLAGSIANSKLANDSVSFGGISLDLGGTDATPAFDLSDATNYPTSALTGTITNAQLAGSIANAKLVNDSVSFGGVSLDLGGSDATPAFDLSDATNYPTSSLSGTITNSQLAGSIANAKLTNSTMSVGGVTLTLGATDATPAFDLSDATNYPTSSLTGTITNAQLAGSIADAKLASTFLKNIVEDTTPELGGNLDVNGNAITGTGNLNLTGIITATSLSSSDNIGIGTNIPDTLLHIKGSSSTQKLITLNSGSSKRNNYIGVTNSDNLELGADEDDEGSDSSIRFRVDGTERLRITSAGNVSIQNDSAKFTAGAGDDLEIYHNGSDSYIDNETGHLYLRNDGTNDNSNIFIQARNGEDSIVCHDDGAVELYRNAVKKFETTSTGIKVYGSINQTEYQAGQIIEQLEGQCDGNDITVRSGTYTLTNVNAVQDGSTSFSNLNGSPISYQPPTGATRVIYEYWVFMRDKDVGPLLHFRGLFDGTEVTNSRHTWRAATSGADYQMWIYNKMVLTIGGGDTDLTIGRVSSWNSAKTIKFQTKEYSASYEARFHQTNHWDGTSSDIIVKPHVRITAIA